MSTTEPKLPDFMSVSVPSLGTVTCHKHDSSEYGLSAVIGFGNGVDTNIFRADRARQLLAAAFKALQILDPAGAPDALVGLIEGDALNKIRQHIAGEQPGQPVTCRTCGRTAPRSQMTVVHVKPVGGDPDDPDVWEAEWYCASLADCNDRRHPQLVTQLQAQNALLARQVADQPKASI